METKLAKRLLMLTLFFLSALVLALTIVGCSSKASPTIVGNWKLHHLASINGESYASTTASATIKDNGSITVSVTEGTVNWSMSGTWKQIPENRWPIWATSSNAIRKVIDYYEITITEMDGKPLSAPFDAAFYEKPLYANSGSDEFAMTGNSSGLVFCFVRA